jgi:hypothetical protein
MGDEHINVSQDETTISASKVDANNNPFTLSGTVSGSEVAFNIEGIGNTPGIGPAFTTYTGILSGNTIVGDFSGSASWSYQDENGNLITETATWAGTFTVIIKKCAAEAIYGRDSEETELLREYRDKVLSKSATGRQMIKTYYELSPAVADVLQKNDAVRASARRVLDSLMPAIRKKVKQ